MALKAQQSDAKHFVIKRSEFNTAKLFAEFYLPDYQTLLNTLRQGRYPLRPLREASIGIFDGPFGSDRKVDMYQESGIPYVRVKQVQHEGIDLSGLVYISQEKHETIIRSRVVPGNVLMTIAGSQLGKAAVFPNTFKEGNITGHIVGIEVKDEINPYYFAVFINSRFGKEQVTRWSHRSTRRELNLHEVGQILVSLPPRDIQDCIVLIMHNAYDNRQKILNQDESKLKFAEHHVLANHLQIKRPEQILENIFTKSISQICNRFDIHHNRPHFELMFVSIREGNYPLLKLRDIAHCIFSGSTPRAKSDAYVEKELEGIPFLRISDINEYSIDVSKALLIRREIHETVLKRSQIQAGDVLLSIAGTIGLAAVVPDDIGQANINQAIAAIRLKAGIVPYYLEIFLNSWMGRFQTTRLSRPVVQANLNHAEIQEILIPIPPESVQHEIVREIQLHRSQVQQLSDKAEAIVSEAKSRVEQMILGEEDIA